MSALSKPTMTVVPAAGAPGTPPNELGVPCYFGRRGLAQPHLLNGWASAEDSHHWNDGLDAALALSLVTMPAQRLHLRVEGRPYLSPRVPRQDITLFFNGARLGFWRIDRLDGALLEAAIEPEHWFGRADAAYGICVFHIPESRRPRDIGEAADDRQLGFCFQSFTLVAPVPKLRG